VFEGVLKEEKIIFKSRQKSLLSIACETLCALLYPFQWHHVYIPVLPLSLLDFLQSPTPYIVGVDTDHLAGASWDVESAEGVSYSHLFTPASRTSLAATLSEIIAYSRFRTHSHKFTHALTLILTLVLTRTLSHSILSLTYLYSHISVLTLTSHTHTLYTLTHPHPLAITNFRLY